jgi:CRISPR/Cas system CSM-associated protein Csm2 small subunit
MNKIGSTSSNNNNKEETFSGYLQDYKSKPISKAATNKKAQQKVHNKDKSKVKRIYLDIIEAHQKFGQMSERMLQLTAKRDNIVLTGKIQPFPACQLYKATQRPDKKTTLMKEKGYIWMYQVLFLIL